MAVNPETISFVLSDDEINFWAEKLEEKSAEEIIRWAVEKFGNKLAIGCSLGAEDMVIMDIAVKIKPDIPFLFIDTDFHFKDTLDTLERAKQRYNANIITVKSEYTPEEQAKKFGPQLFFTDPNLCCTLRKVLPIKSALSNYHAWITGIRREQAPTRRNAKVVEKDKVFGLIKINPLVRWTFDEVWNYIRKNNVPYNRLHDLGYPSIGCAPCTQPVRPGQDLRAGRWAGTGKTECGLHSPDDVKKISE
jgi:phosphoadenosine phosphosulfate reductase